MLRLRTRLPMGVALAIIGAAYVIRAVTRHGGDLRPELPEDLVVATVVVVGLGGIAWARRQFGDHAPEQDDRPDEQDA